MGKALRYFFEHHKIALSGALIAVALMMYFGVKMGLNFIYFNDPAHRNEALKPWMTPRYVGMSYKLPPRIINDVMQFNPQKDGRMTIDDIADRQGITLPELESLIRIEAENAEKDRQRRNRPNTKDAPLMDALVPTDRQSEAAQ